MEKIDLVITFVDSSDIKWQELYQQHAPATQDEQVLGKQRFRSSAHFKYLFRGVEKYVPWINNVFLVVQSKTQIPLWIDTSNVKVILHEDIIPQEYLPVFNSQAIEMFLHKISGLSEKFLYANDDNYFVGDMKPEDFFIDNKVRTLFTKSSYGQEETMPLWKVAIINSSMLISREETEKLKSEGSYISPMHGIRPYLKSKIEEVYQQHSTEILNSITKFRERKNFTVYLFDFYLKKLGLTVDKNYKFSYFSSSSSAGLICASIINPHLYKTICINDTSENYDKERENIITKHFESQFSQKSKYEKT